MAVETTRVHFAPASACADSEALAVALTARGIQNANDGATIDAALDFRAEATGVSGTLTLTRAGESPSARRVAAPKRK